MQGKTVEEVIRGWENNLEVSLKNFQDHTTKLRDSELKLYEHLDTFEVI